MRREINFVFLEILSHVSVNGQNKNLHFLSMKTSFLIFGLFLFQRVFRGALLSLLKIISSQSLYSSSHLSLKNVLLRTYSHKRKKSVLSISSMSLSKTLLTIFLQSFYFCFFFFIETFILKSRQHR